jgi:hypothetical protein
MKMAVYSGDCSLTWASNIGGVLHCPKGLCLENVKTSSAEKSA